MCEANGLDCPLYREEWLAANEERRCRGMRPLSEDVLGFGAY